MRESAAASVPYVPTAARDPSALTISTKKPGRFGMTWNFIGMEGNMGTACRVINAEWLGFLFRTGSN
jgi:hypothetical protein